MSSRHIAKVFFVSPLWEMWKFQKRRAFDLLSARALIMRCTHFSGWLLHIKASVEYIVVYRVQVSTTSHKIGGNRLRTFVCYIMHFGAMHNTNYQPMKRLLCVALLFIGLGFLTSCGKTGGSGSLVGTWDRIEFGFEVGSKYTKVPINTPCYWVITNTTLTCYDEGDALNGVAVEYSYSNSTITAFGMECFKVLLLTQTELKVRNNIKNGDGSYSVITFRKR